MVEQTVALCRQLGAGEDRDVLLQPLAQAACEQLRSRLRPGVAPEDCGGVFPMAAAMLVLDCLGDVTGDNQVTAFTAGEVSIRKENTSSGALARTARQMLSPWTTDDGFAFRGVMG